MAVMAQTKKNCKGTNVQGEQSAGKAVSKCSSDHRGGSVGNSEEPSRSGQVSVYSIERWQAQKRSDEAWNGLVSCCHNDISSTSSETNTLKEEVNDKSSSSGLGQSRLEHGVKNKDEELARGRWLATLKRKKIVGRSHGDQGEWR